MIFSHPSVSQLAELPLSQLIGLASTLNIALSHMGVNILPGPTGSVVQLTGADEIRGIAEIFPNADAIDTILAGVQCTLFLVLY